MNSNDKNITEEAQNDIQSVAQCVYFSTIRKQMHCTHRLKAHGLMHIESGTLHIESPDFCLDAAAGDYVFWRRDCTATMEKRAMDGGIPFKSIAINFTRDFLKDYFANQLSQHHLPSKVTSLPVSAIQLQPTEALESIFSRLESYRGEHTSELTDDVRIPIMWDAVQCLLSADVQFFPTLFDFYETWKIDLMDFMENHFTEDLSISEFASYTGRSLATFKRDFEKISNLSPERWILEQRLVLAHHLMTDDGMRVGEAFMQSGFKNRSHFSTSFKRRFGYSPSKLSHSY